MERGEGEDQPYQKPPWFFWTLLHTSWSETRTVLVTQEGNVGWRMLRSFLVSVGQGHPRKPRGAGGAQASGTDTYPVMTSLSEMVHEEPQHVAVKQVSVVQAVLVSLPLVLLDHLETRAPESDKTAAAVRRCHCLPSLWHQVKPVYSAIEFAPPREHQESSA